MSAFDADGRRTSIAERFGVLLDDFGAGYRQESRSDSTFNLQWLEGSLDAGQRSGITPICPVQLPLGRDRHTICAFVYAMGGCPEFLDAFVEKCRRAGELLRRIPAFAGPISSFCPGNAERADSLWLTFLLLFADPRPERRFNGSFVVDRLLKSPHGVCMDAIREAGLDTDRPAWPVERFRRWCEEYRSELDRCDFGSLTFLNESFSDPSGTKAAQRAVVHVWRRLPWYGVDVDEPDIHSVADAVQALGQAASRLSPDGTHETATNYPSPAPTPHWDRDRMTLSYGGQTVRCFSRNAPNQFTILDVFEEEGWRPRIDNPLPGDSNRLRDAVSALNTDLRLIRFERDGTGEGVRWKSTNASSTDLQR